MIGRSKRRRRLCVLEVEEWTDSGRGGGEGEGGVGGGGGGGGGGGLVSRKLLKLQLVSTHPGSPALLGG